MLIGIIYNIDIWIWYITCWLTLPIPQQFRHTRLEWSSTKVRATDDLTEFEQIHRALYPQNQRRESETCWCVWQSPEIALDFWRLWTMLKPQMLFEVPTLDALDAFEKDGSISLCTRWKSWHIFPRKGVLCESMQANHVSHIWKYVHICIYIYICIHICMCTMGWEDVNMF